MATVTLTPARLEAASIQRKPAWIRVKAPVSEAYHETRRLMREKRLHTVCEEAACPNIGECWQQKHATVMILGDTCTRACAFCNVKTGMPKAVDPDEPRHLAEAIAEMGYFPRRYGLGRAAGRTMRAAHRALQVARPDRRAAPPGEGLPERYAGGFRFVARKPG